MVKFSFMKDKKAVISLGGKQHLITVGANLDVNRLSNKVGDKIETDALMVSEGDKVKVGTPKVAKSKVSLKVLAHNKQKKVTVSRFRAKSRYRRKYGHRQPTTKVEVTAING